MVIKYVITIIVSYLLGCLHPAYFLGRMTKKLDIRQHGTNNSGTSNAMIVLGFKYGAITFLCDFFKGAAAVLIAKYCIADTPTMLYTAFIAAFLGHLFPFYLKFKGGKGLAVTLGATLGINPLLCLVLLLVLAVVSVLTQYLVAGTVTVSLLVPVYTGYVYGATSIPFILALVVCLMMIYMHKANYVKIYKHEEPRLFNVLGIHKKKNNGDDSERGA